MNIKGGLTEKKRKPFLKGGKPGVDRRKIFQAPGFFWRLWEKEGSKKSSGREAKGAITVHKKRISNLDTAP